MYKSCISFVNPLYFKSEETKFWEIECKWLSNACLLSLWWKLSSLLQYMQTILPWFSRTTKPIIWYRFPGDPSDEELTCQWRRCKSCGFDPWVCHADNPLQHPLPKEIHGQRSLEGYSPNSRTRLKQLSTHTLLTQICSPAFYFQWRSTSHFQRMNKFQNNPRGTR